MRSPIPAQGRVPIPQQRPQMPQAGMGQFPPAPMAPQQRGNRFMGAISQNPEVLLALGAGLLGGRTGPEQWSGGLSGMAQTMGAAKEKAETKKKANQTRAALEKMGAAPELLSLAENGAISWGDAYKYHREAQTPKKADVSWQELPDGTYGWANKDDQSWNPIGKAQKPNSGFEVTLPDGTSVRNGSFGNQDSKNVANRVTDQQGLAASGSALKQTVQILRKANKNTGYSGVGGGVIGGALDAAEQFGINTPGDPGSRAIMRSGGLDVALQQVQKTKGAISNAEMSLFMAASPGMQTTPEGNEALFGMIDAIADRQIQKAKEMESWRQQYGTLDGFEPAWGEYINNNPIITEDMFAQPGGAPQPTPQQGAQRKRYNPQTGQIE